MKKLVLFLLLLAMPRLHAAPHDVFIQQRNATDTGNVINFLNFTAPSLYGYDGAAHLPKIVTLGSGVEFSSWVLRVDSTIPRFGDISDVGLSNDYNDLDNKPTLTTGPKGDKGDKGDGGDTGAQGAAGSAGAPGSQGIQGVAGTTGATGSNGSNGSAATIAVGTVTTGTAGSSATVTNAGTSGAATFNFVIPRGDTGSTGANGTNGTNATTTSNATTSVAGLMSPTDKTKLDAYPSYVARSFNNAASKTLVTSTSGQGGVILDASRDALVNYSVSTSTTATIGGASTVTVFLEIADTNSAAGGAWTTIAKQSNSQTITLAIALQSVQTNVLNFGAIVPAGKYVRVRYSTTGTGSCSYDSGQEVLL